MPDRGVREHDHFVQFWADSALCSRAAGGLDRKTRRLSNVIGAYPKDKADHWTAFDPTALVRG